MSDFNNWKIENGHTSLDKWNGLVVEMIELERYAHGIYLESENPENGAAAARVGIKTTTPKEDLQIGDRWTFHNGGSKFISYNSFYDGSKIRRIVKGKASELRFDADGDIHIRTAGLGDPESEVEYLSGITLRNTGNVGIGTTDPTQKLHLVDGNLSLETTGREANHRKLMLMNTEILPNRPNSSYGFKFSWRNDDDSYRKDALLFDKSGDVYFGGNVGIGTHQPSEKLHVVGEVFAVNLRSSSDTIVNRNLTVNGQTTIKNINVEGTTKKTGPITPKSGTDDNPSKFFPLEVPNGKVVVGIEVKRVFVEDKDKDFYSFKLLYR